MDDWRQPTEYPPLPKPLFLRALREEGATIDPAKRASPGVFEIQRQARVTWLEIHDEDAWIPPLSVEGVCDELAIDLEAFYARAQRLAASDGPATA